MHHLTKKKLEREAMEASQGEKTPAETVENTLTTEDFTPVNNMDSVFGEDNMPTDNNDTITIPKSEWKQFLIEHNQLMAEKNQSQIIDPHNKTERKRTLRIAFYTNQDNETYIVKGFTEQTKINGSVVTTWNKGVDDETKLPITWCQPILQHVETNEVSSPLIRYSDFIDSLSTIPLDMKKEVAEEVDTTGIEELVEVTSYVDTNGGRVNAQGTGIKVRASVIAIRKKFTVEYKGKMIEVSEQVVNIL